MGPNCSLDIPLESLLGLLACPGNSNVAIDTLSRSLEACRNCGSGDCPGLAMLLINATVSEAQREYTELSAAMRQTVSRPRMNAA